MSAPVAEIRLDPAATVIEMCGGIDAVAAIVNCNRSTVYRWTQPDGPRCGTGGNVPLRHILTLMQAKPGLTFAHFFDNVGKPQGAGKP